FDVAGAIFAYERLDRFDALFERLQILCFQVVLHGAPANFAYCRPDIGAGAYRAKSGSGKRPVCLRSRNRRLPLREFHTEIMATALANSPSGSSVLGSHSW